MSIIPISVLSKLYNRTSLRNAENAVRFSVKNRLSPAALRRVIRLELDSNPVELERISIAAEAGAPFPGQRDHGEKAGRFSAGRAAVL